MRGGRSDGGSARNAGAGCAGRATGRTGLSQSEAEWSGDAAAHHAETGRWSATAQGGAAKCSGAERKPGRVGGVKFEPEVVPPEPAETGRPEAEQRSTAEAEAGAGRRGCCGARAAVAEPAGASAAEAEQVPGGGVGRSGKEKPQCEAHWRAICGGGSRPERTESRPCGQRSQGQRRERKKGGAGAGCPEGSDDARGDQSARERTPQDGCAACGAPDEDGSGRAG